MRSIVALERRKPRKSLATKGLRQSGSGWRRRVFGFNWDDVFRRVNSRPVDSRPLAERSRFPKKPKPKSHRNEGSTQSVSDRSVDIWSRLVPRSGVASRLHRGPRSFAEQQDSVRPGTI